MATRKKSLSPEIQRLKDQLWDMVLELNFTQETIENLEDNGRYNDWDSKMTRLQGEGKLPAPADNFIIPAFSVAESDLEKIRQEVSDSCLTNASKRSILAAVKNAKKES